MPWWCIIVMIAGIRISQEIFAIDILTALKLSLSLTSIHISRKDSKHMFANKFLSCPDMAWSPYRKNDHKY